MQLLQKLRRSSQCNNASTPIPGGSRLWALCTSSGLVVPSSHSLSSADTHAPTNINAALLTGSCLPCTMLFRSLLVGQWFTAFCHKPLTFAIANGSDPWSICQQWYLSYISEFTMGNTLLPSHLGLDYTHLAGNQTNIPGVQSLKNVAP